LPTMAPLLKSTDEHKVDVYFSTWSESHHVHPLDSTLAHHVVDITSEKIFDVLHDYDVKGVVVEEFDSEYWATMQYNCPMVHRWKEGMKLIKDSGIDYDFVIIIRPDLYFRSNTKIDWDTLQKHALYSLWWRGDRLADLILIADPTTMGKVLITVNEWNVLEDADWHSGWTRYIWAKDHTDIRNIDVSAVMLRPMINFVNSFSDALINFNKWRDMTIEHQRQTMGLEMIRKHWGKELVDKLYPALATE
jgi:hypothetical protein